MTALSALATAPDEAAARPASSSPAQPLGLPVILVDEAALKEMAGERRSASRRSRSPSPARRRSRKPRRSPPPAKDRGCSARASSSAPSPARSPSAETAHDRAFHRRRPGRGRPDHGARRETARRLPGLPLCRLDRLAGTAGALRGRTRGSSTPRRCRSTRSRRNMSPPTPPARMSRGCIRATCRCGARSPSRSAGWRSTASPTR